MENPSILPLNKRLEVDEALDLLSKATGLTTENIRDSSPYLRGTLEHYGDKVNICFYPAQSPGEFDFFVYEKDNNEHAPYYTTVRIETGKITYGREQYHPFEEVLKLMGSKRSGEI